MGLHSRGGGGEAGGAKAQQQESSTQAGGPSTTRTAPLPAPAAATAEASPVLSSSCPSDSQDEAPSVSIHYVPSSPSAIVSFLSLLRLALPSILLQSGAPLAITFQTALIGRKATALVAAWAIVATATNAATVIFNFLVVGVTAKVTKVVAVGAWAQVGSRIRTALSMALVMGVAACCLLLALQRPLWSLLDASSPLVLQVAEAYFYLRVAGVPPQLLVMCTSGILQGYKRVNLVAFLQGLRVLLDVAASYVSLYVLDWGLVGVGMGTILASTLVATAALTCILLLPPEEGRHKILVFAPLLASLQQWGRGRRRSSEHEHGDLENASERLLGEAEEEEGRDGGATVGKPVVAVPSVESEEEERVNAVLNESLWKFVWDGLSTMWRSAMVQASFFLVLACATGLGMYAVAAHQVLMQLWMINIYIADGFATAGTIVCSSLAGHLAQAVTKREKQRHLADLRLASWRVLYLGVAAGISLAAVYYVFEEELISLFTHDPNTKAQLRTVWLYLVVVQPLNSIVFVYDGLIYAAQAFSYMAVVLTIGFFVIFVPWIALSHFYFKTLLSAWVGKGLLNAVRFVGAGYKVHYQFLNPPSSKDDDLLTPPPPDDESLYGASDAAALLGRRGGGAAEEDDTSESDHLAAGSYDLEGSLSSDSLPEASLPAPKAKD